MTSPAPDPIARMHEQLRDALGPRYQPQEDGSVQLAPVSERELLLALKLVRDHGGRLHRGAVPLSLSRRSLQQIGPFEPQGATAVAEAGARLEEIERAAAAHQLTLGPLPPRALPLELGDFLEGPYAGLRSVPGGRLEPLSVSLTALMPDGLIAATRAAPRHAAGPGMDAFFLGGGGRMGLLLRATVRLFPKPQSSRTATFSLPSPAGLARAVRRALLDGACVERLRVEPREGQALAEARVAGSPAQVERDLATFGQHVLGQGGRVAALKLGRPEAPPGDPPREREARWEAVAAALEAGGSAALYRLHAGGAVAEGPVEGRDLSSEPA
ncbi:MAG TPA: FAD-binding protein, partial [Myxococcales bacterium]|nr:FAD-binding protein [Myxococcales bacterium]